MSASTYLPGIATMSPSMSLHARLSRVATQNSLRMVNLKQLTGLETALSSPGISSQWRNRKVRERMTDLFSAGDDAVARIIDATGTIEAWVPWLSQGSTPDIEGIAVAALLPSTDELHYCRTCWSNGYHTLLYQLPWIDDCPFHHTKILKSCHFCGSSTGMNSARNTVTHPFRCDHCNGQIGGIRVSRSPADIERVALEWLVECSDYRSGTTHPRYTASVLTIPHANQDVVNDMCRMTHGFIFGKECLSPIGLQWIAVPERTEQVSAIVRAILPSGILSTDAESMIAGVSVGMMTRSANEFLDMFHAAYRKRLRWRGRDLADRKSRASLITSQYARRTLAETWIRCMATCDGLMRESPSSDIPRFVQWMLSGPIWALGRYGAVQAALGVDAIPGETFSPLAGARHAAVVCEDFQSSTTRRLIAVSDRDLMEAMAAALPLTERRETSC